jgi:hypothetical protein
MVVWPKATPVARPVLLIVATAGLEEVQLAVDVRSRVLESLYTPVAVNCSVPPGWTEELEDEMVIDVRAATLKFTALLCTPFTVTTTPPEEAPLGTVAVMLESLQQVPQIAAGNPLKVTVLVP